MPDAVLELSDIVRRYGEGAQAIEVLSGASAVVRRGEAVALVGPSGAGKCTTRAPWACSALRRACIAASIAPPQ